MSRAGLPRISIITPSYNQALYLGETIGSVLGQGYPSLEFIIIDGGSTDGSVDIIRKYERHLAYWVSEPDRGQTHAINKGLAKATGEILAYLNSDDYYLPGALFTVAGYFQAHPRADLVHGRCRYVDAQGATIGGQLGDIARYDDILDLWDVWWNRRQFVQPEVFWSRRITDQIGAFRQDLYFVMDYEYWARILKAGGTVGRIDQELACFRFTPDQKSTRRKEVAAELLEVVRPLLWEAGGPLTCRRRAGLQANWLYHAVFLREIEKSVTAGESAYRHWLRLLTCLARHPRISLASGFREKLLAITFGRY